MLEEDGTISSCQWANLRVGQLVQVRRDELLPADLALLTSSEPEGICCLETSNLDGESSLKMRQSLPQLATLPPHQLRGTLSCDQPNDDIYRFDGVLHLHSPSSSSLSLNHNQFLPRGAMLKNTQWICAVVVYTGHDTKIMHNSQQRPHKRTRMDRFTNTQTVYIVAVLFFLVAVSLLGHAYYVRTAIHDHRYVHYPIPATWLEALRTQLATLVSFLLLLNNLVPISLSITMESVRLLLASLVDSDMDMYDAETDTPAAANSSALLEELGQVEYILTDKTGTLTCNQMRLLHVIVRGELYRDCTDATSGMMRVIRAARSPDVDLFLTMLSVSHTVMIDPSTRGDRVNEQSPPAPALAPDAYQASSPDELAMVRAAAAMSYRFVRRAGSAISVNVGGETRVFHLLAVIEFTSARRRMSTVIQTSEGRILLLCKGADSVIVERLSERDPATIATSLRELDTLAVEGLRTLCFAYRELSVAEWDAWLVDWTAALNTTIDRQTALDRVADRIEHGLVFLGATGIEDRLQDGVTDAIQILRKASMRIWMLTGDRAETAVNTGFLAGLLHRDTVQLHLPDDSLQATFDALRGFKHRMQDAPGTPFALVATGSALAPILALDTADADESSTSLAIEARDELLAVARQCQTCIFCRLSPLQKAQIARLVARHLDKTTLAIGDGGNDVSMIQAASVGVGIAGREGMQAARSADFVIAKFRFLPKLLLVHGAWSLHRLSRVVLYVMYKNITLFLCQFWFAWLNMFSAKSLFPSWMLMTFNLLFTALPPALIGLTDQYVTAPELLKHPQLYQFGQGGKFYNSRAFWECTSNGLVHSIMLAVAFHLLIRRDVVFQDGTVMSLSMTGALFYLVILVTISLKALLFTNYFTVLLAGALLASPLLWLVLFSGMNALLGETGITAELLSAPFFWATILVIPVLVVMRDFMWKFYRRQFRPRAYHIVQEMTAMQSKDHRRDSREKIKSAPMEATRQPPQSRGFVFAQSEGQGRMFSAYGLMNNLNHSSLRK